MQVVRIVVVHGRLYFEAFAVIGAQVLSRLAMRARTPGLFPLLRPLLVLPFSLAL